jgi:GNAT superfamily N-acetyltransferase
MTDYTIRPVTGADQAQIAHHRYSMFTEMGVHTTEQIAAMMAVYPAWLERHLSNGDYRGWFAVAPSGLVIGGVGMWLEQFIPGPDNPDKATPHIIDVYVHYEHRRKGIARALMDHTLAWCYDQGYPKITLNASKAGQALYESMGFVVDNRMSLWLEYPSGGSNGDGPRDV